MPKNIVSFEDLYQEIAEIARENSVSSAVEWEEIVSDVIDGYLDMGEMDLDQDTEGYKVSLSLLWGRFKKESAEEELSPEEDIVPENYKGDKNDEFDTVEDFGETVRKENEGF